MKRQNTTLESEGAEFLVLGNLLIRGIPSYKTYTNMPRYDIVATNPEKNKSVMIQVKSRWRTKADGFIIQNFDSDFTVICKLNRGDKTGKHEIKPPEFFVFSTLELKELYRSNSWNKINFRNIPNFVDHANKWDLIEDALNSNSQ